MSTSVILYQTATRTNAKPLGAPRRKYILPPQSPNQFSAYELEQEYEMVLDGFPPAPKNTPSTNVGLADANAILTGYSQPGMTAARMGRFAATFNIVPASWDDFQPMPFTFPGFPGTYGENNVRDPFTDVVLARVRHDYFLIDPGNVAAGVLDSSGAAIVTAASLSLIPIIAKTYFLASPGGGSGNAQPTVRTNSIIPAGGKTIAGNAWNETWPNLALYQGWAANATANAWTSTAWAGQPTAGSVGQIVAEDSKLTAYAGNIISRTTTYILVR